MCYEMWARSLGIRIVGLTPVDDRVQVVRIGVTFLALCKLVTSIEIIVEQVEDSCLHKQRLGLMRLSTHQP
jgi:hypothetical protein